jgi:hypothetical protein
MAGGAFATALIHAATEGAHRLTQTKPSARARDVRHAATVSSDLHLELLEHAPESSGKRRRSPWRTFRRYLECGFASRPIGTALATVLHHDLRDQGRENRRDLHHPRRRAAEPARPVSARRRSAVSNRRARDGQQIVVEEHGDCFVLRVCLLDTARIAAARRERCSVSCAAQTRNLGSAAAYAHRRKYPSC